MNLEVLLKRKLETEYVDARELVNDPDNVRMHPPRNRESVKRSLIQYGIRKPVAAHQKTKIVYAGNLTLDVFLELADEGKTDGYQIPVAWIPADVSVAVCKAYGIADNRTSELADFQTDALSALLSELEQVHGMDIEDMGFIQSELDGLLSADIDRELNPPQLEDDDEVSYQVVVECKDEAWQRKVYDYLMEGGYSCRIVTL